MALWRLLWGKLTPLSQTQHTALDIFLRMRWILVWECLSHCRLQSRCLAWMQTSNFCEELDLKCLFKSQICSTVGPDAAYGTWSKRHLCRRPSFTLSQSFPLYHLVSRNTVAHQTSVGCDQFLKMTYQQLGSKKKKSFMVLCNLKYVTVFNPIGNTKILFAAASV